MTFPTGSAISEDHKQSTRTKDQHGNSVAVDNFLPPRGFTLRPEDNEIKYERSAEEYEQEKNSYPLRSVQSLFS